MNTMTLQQTYALNIQGHLVTGVTLVEEWNGFIELRASPNNSKIIIRRKDWNNGKKWQMESNAFLDQEIEVMYADKRLGLPPTEVIFTPPDESNG